MHNKFFYIIFKKDVYGKITNANYMGLVQMCGIIEATLLEPMATLCWIHHDKLGPTIFPATAEVLGVRTTNSQWSQYTEMMFTNCTRQNGVEYFIPVRHLSNLLVLRRFLCLIYE